MASSMSGRAPGVVLAAGGRSSRLCVQSLAVLVIGFARLKVPVAVGALFHGSLWVAAGPNRVLSQRLLERLGSL